MSLTYATGDAPQPGQKRGRGTPNVVKRGFDVLNRSWQLIRDCLAGEQAIKNKTDTYLPRPNPEDTSAENQARYDSYVERAVFYNVTRRTMSGLTGQVYTRDPMMKVPDELQNVIEDATGLGVSIIQLSKTACSYVIAMGRSGIFTDYPNTGQLPASKADIAAGKIRPILRVYPPWDLINWRIEPRDGKLTLTLVVMREDYIRQDDGFLEVIGSQWRVLWINDAGVYQMDTYKDVAPSVVVDTVIPVDATGKPFNELPFMFMGSENNDPDPDYPPLYDLASLNIAHYRNSADYEESCFITGQPTPYFTGLTEAWVTNVLKGKVMLGARSAIPLPVGATAGLLQVQSNTLPYEAMQHKERQMVALGAKLVEQAMVQRTATETSLEKSDETSILSTAADNVSIAFEFALKFATRFVGIDGSEIEFELNTEFDLVKMTPADRLQLIAEWVSSAISWPEMRENMRRGGIATQPDDKALADIQANPPPQLTVPGMPAVKPNTPPVTTPPASTTTPPAKP